MRLRTLINARLLCLVLLVLLLALFNHVDGSPKRDHLTRQEADMIRDTQELDKRITVLIKAAERRLAAVTNPNAPKPTQSELELWGEIKGTRADYLYDLSMILDEAITNIDDVSGRDESNPLIPKALRKLAEASSGFLSQLAPLRDRLDERTELKSLDQAIDNAQSIVEAAAKLPPPVKKKKDGKQ